MRTLMEHGPFADDGNSIECAMEHGELQRFQSELAAENVGVENMSCRDHRALLARMRVTVDDLELEDYVGYQPGFDLPDEVAELKATWRATRDEWDPYDIHADVAKAHWDAGIPLDFFQRFPPRKRGRRPSRAPTTPGS
jgi:alkylhydroperoxidase family enzyme